MNEEECQSGNGPDLKSETPYGCVGSNPTSSAKHSDRS